VRVAGGMQRRRGPTLAERSGVSVPTAVPPEAEEPRRRVVVTRHCWVTGLPDRPGRWAGLLVEWRQADTGEWLGRVAYVVEDDARPVLVEAWLPGTRLRPA
jgi:hypothetical protein